MQDLYIMDTLPLWILMTAYAAHIMEEYVLGWKDWAERMSGDFIPTSSSLPDSLLQPASFGK